METNPWFNAETDTELLKIRGSEMTTLNNLPTATYPGDVTCSIGQVVGPNTTGEYLVIDGVFYNKETDKSTATFRYARADEVNRMMSA